MFMRKALIYLLICNIFAPPNVVAQLSLEKVMEVVGSGANDIDFSSSFAQDDGTPCDKCSFCTGSALRSLFIRKTKSMCVTCEEGNKCNALKVNFSFNKAWAMSYFSLISSDALSSEDPSKVVINGSKDKEKWTVLTEVSELNFSERDKSKDIIFDNEEEFPHYSITFFKKNTSANMKIGHLNVIDPYFKQYIVETFKKFTGKTSLGLPTIAPTPSPTDTPTNTPTNSPTLPPKNIALEGTASQSSTFYADGAWRAIDGNTNGWTRSTFAITQPTYKPWWKVKLRAKAVITKIIVWNRMSDGDYRPDNGDVKIYNGSIEVAKGTWGAANGRVSFEFEFDNVVGDEVKVQLHSTKTFLQLAEVQVFGNYK